MPSFKKIRLDTDAMDKGVWHTFFTDAETGKSIRAQIGSINSPNYTKAVSELTRRRRQEIKSNGGNLPAEAIDEIQREAAGLALLNNWEGIEDDAGNVVPWSRPTAVSFMKDRAYSDFYDWVSEMASARQHFRVEAIANAAKNSSSVSNGS